MLSLAVEVAIRFGRGPGDAFGVVGQCVFVGSTRPLVTTGVVGGLVAGEATARIEAPSKAVKLACGEPWGFRVGEEPLAGLGHFSQFWGAGEPGGEPEELFGSGWTGATWW